MERYRAILTEQDPKAPPTKREVDICVADHGQVWLEFPGYETVAGDSLLIGVEVWQGKLQTMVWNEPEIEDPQTTVLEQMRRVDACRTEFYELAPSRTAGDRYE